MAEISDGQFGCLVMTGFDPLASAAESREVVLENLRLVAENYRQAELISRLKEEVSKLKQTNIELESLVITDPLTGVYNRRFVDTVIDRMFSHRNTPIAILAFDVDEFKKFNDTNGHPAGDRLLKIIARALVDSVRPGDFVTRVGGDEFLAFLPHFDPDLEIKDIGARFTVRLAKVCDLAKIESPVTVSYGWAKRSDGQTLLSVIEAADEDLFRSKSPSKRW